MFQLDVSVIKVDFENATVSLDEVLELSLAKAIQIGSETLGVHAWESGLNCGVDELWSLLGDVEGEDIGGILRVLVSGFAKSDATWLLELGSSEEWHSDGLLDLGGVFGEDSSQAARCRGS